MDREGREVSYSNNQLALVWERQFGRRNHDNFYNTEDDSITFTPGDKSGLIRSFLDDFRSGLDPPRDLRFAELRRLLIAADIDCFANMAIDETQDVFLLDDREDPTKTDYSARIWDSERRGEGPVGYLNHPPRGKIVVSKRVSINEFIRRMREKVC
jgi:hypothetical protein